ncbi:MAG: hypothetical protein QM639_15665 [Rhodocyclaceae bacterium]
MASGASVIANENLASEISAQNKDLLAIEMEAYAVMAASEYLPFQGLKSIVIKSVCDHADHRKNNDWQRYASYTSACFAGLLFKRLPFD